MTADNKTGGGHPGMMGDGTEEQNLNQKGNPDARITEGEVDEAFGKGGDAQRAGGGKATGDASQVTKQVSNDLSDAKAAPQDTQPKDNSHNFT